ncbi:hypothetical protein MNBD_BACTEROID07-488 [hydrothermal vent metagenome]|uniref:DUF4834 domain-containing protein n=1 Tax=hydrothermal vent metagenome TaxID=652676 RepID=A0A3B0UF66_9ZZZZ
MGLLKVIFILILIWYVIKLIVRYVVPKIILRFINKQQGFSNDDNRRKPAKEGEVNIKMEHPSKSKIDEDDFGEYVDFEEVKPEQKPEDE